MSGIDSIINTAKTFVGTTEGSNNHREIIDRYNRARYSDAYQMTMNDPWCCAFVVAVFEACNMSDIIPAYAYCDGMIQIFKQWNRFHQRIGYTPKKGDIVFYDWNGDSSSDHVGIVSDYSFGNITAIEGNKSDAVGYRKINADSPQIIGYGSPNYEGSDGNGNNGNISNNVSHVDNVYINSLPLLMYGKTGIYVKILQVLLNYYIHSNLDVDGDFGPRTKSAVADYQIKYRLEVDGICGKETWTHLLLKQ